MQTQDACKNVLVVGLGVSGGSAAEFLLQKGFSVTAVDRKAPILEESAATFDLRARGLKILPDNTPLELESYAFIVVSPGIAPTHPICLKAAEKGIKVIGEIELACRELKQPFLGITGTNGKTTVSLLVGHILNHCGINAKVLGNVGIPLSSQLAEASNAVIVCELSSYQLETLESTVIDSGVILNITPDHLDRYSNMQEYAKAKIKIAACLKKNGSFYVGKKTLEEFKELFAAFIPKTFGFTPDCDIYCDQKCIFVKENIELILPDHYRGKSSHDVENLMAAFVLCREMGIGAELFSEALATFTKPPHRIEFVREVAGVKFYNDSKGTNLDAVIRAVESLSGKIVLIAGGVAKGCSFTPWLSAFGEKVKYVCAIGEAKSIMIEQLSGSYTVEACETLESAVEKAFTVAREGESVLLSPGCASLDMFKNFEHRGDRFKEIVQDIKV